MADTKAFTLIEIVVVMVIIGILAAIAMPSYFSSLEQNNAQRAENNLLAVSAAQEKFNEDYSSSCASANISPCYCSSTGTNPTGLTTLCGNSTADLDTNLKLNMGGSGDKFDNSALSSYSCTAKGSSYTCTATDGTVTLTSNPTATVTGISCSSTSNPVPNNIFASCPVSCSSANTNNCPSNLQ